MKSYFNKTTLLLKFYIGKSTHQLINFMINVTAKLLHTMAYIADDWLLLS